MPSNFYHPNMWVSDPFHYLNYPWKDPMVCYCMNSLLWNTCMNGDMVIKNENFGEICDRI